MKDVSGVVKSINWNVGAFEVTLADDTSWMVDPNAKITNGASRVFLSPAELRDWIEPLLATHQSVSVTLYPDSHNYDISGRADFMQKVGPNGTETM